MSDENAAIVPVSAVKPQIRGLCTREGWGGRQRNSAALSCLISDFHGSGGDRDAPSTAYTCHWCDLPRCIDRRAAVFVNDHRASALSACAHHVRRLTVQRLVRPLLVAEGRRKRSTASARPGRRQLVHWYKHEHRYSAIRFVTPAQCHAAPDAALLRNRDEVYRAYGLRIRRAGAAKRATRRRSPSSISIQIRRLALQLPAVGFFGVPGRSSRYGVRVGSPICLEFLIKRIFLTKWVLTSYRVTIIGLILFNFF